MVRFIHTADWQVGKPFARVAAADKRARLRNERIEVIRRIGEVGRERQAAFVLVAGDLFDSATPDRATVSATCAAIGSIGVPVFVIPGNHDHAGPGSVWEQAFFIHEREQLAPNLRVLTRPEAVEACGAVILPCPLLRRQSADDPTAWLWNPTVTTGLPSDRPRIVLAHGSVQDFSSTADDEEGGGQPNRIAIDRLPAGLGDYVALGDWHGMKQVGDQAWYSGTPEPDRFPRGGGNEPGYVLCVELPGRGRPPAVTPVATGRIGWRELTFPLTDDNSLDQLNASLANLFAHAEQLLLLRLALTGGLSFEGERRLRAILESQEARLLRLALDNRVRVLPSADEIAQLSRRADDPLISTIAARLLQAQAAGGEPAAVALGALKELWLTVRQEEMAR